MGTRARRSSMPLNRSACTLTSTVRGTCVDHSHRCVTTEGDIYVCTWPSSILKPVSCVWGRVWQRVVGVTAKLGSEGCLVHRLHRLLRTVHSRSVRPCHGKIPICWRSDQHPRSVWPCHGKDPICWRSGLGGWLHRSLRRAAPPLEASPHLPCFRLSHSSSNSPRLSRTKPFATVCLILVNAQSVWKAPHSSTACRHVEQGSTSLSCQNLGPLLSQSPGADVASIDTVLENGGHATAATNRNEAGARHLGRPTAQWRSLHGTITLKEQSPLRAGWHPWPGGCCC